MSSFSTIILLSFGVCSANLSLTKNDQQVLHSPSSLVQGDKETQEITGKHWAIFAVCSVAADLFVFGILMFSTIWLKKSRGNYGYSEYSISGPIGYWGAACMYAVPSLVILAIFRWGVYSDYQWISSFHSQTLVGFLIIAPFAASSFLTVEGDEVLGDDYSVKALQTFGANAGFHCAIFALTAATAEKKVEVEQKQEIDPYANYVLTDTWAKHKIVNGEVVEKQELIKQRPSENQAN